RGHHFDVVLVFAATTCAALMVAPNARDLVIERADAVSADGTRLARLPGLFEEFFAFEELSRNQRVRSVATTGPRRSEGAKRRDRATGADHSSSTKNISLDSLSVATHCIPPHGERARALGA